MRLIKSGLNAIVGGSVAFVLSGCATGSLLAPFPETSGAVTASATAPVAEGGAGVSNAAEVQQVLYQYKLGSGDKVRLIVFGEKELSGEFVVNGAGTISLPLIGEVKASGLTVTELQESVAKSYGNGYLKDPKINFEVLNFRPFYILGEVNKPGEYPYSTGLTVVNAVARAEGYTYRADTRRVFIKHANQQSEVEVPLGTSVLVAPGDTIR
ncbi:polysaccharide biosynthesis/export family protein, partial [Asticcacaulis sp. W401b]|uniref:polysaccharide biosynthesis/export family protein n=1 Tax=Asticcacaulis sp. W401b TaxID=3388666 RepID=UPI00397089B1